MNYAENYLNAMCKTTHAMNRASLEKFKDITPVGCDARVLNRFGVEVVLDIGCGDGSSTVQVLKPFMGNDVKLEASDISESMVEHAVDNHGDQCVKFFVWDVLNNKAAIEIAERYNQVYSFLCFHYCQDLRKALQNVHNILKPGGSLLFTMMVRLPFYEAFKKLSRYPAWAPYLDEDTVSQYSAPLQFEVDPEAFCMQLMTECGFGDVRANFGTEQIIMDSWEQFAGLAKFGDRFMDKLPEDLREQYFDDYLKEMKTVENFISEKCNEDGKSYIEMNQDFFPHIICYGVKSGVSS